MNIFSKFAGFVREHVFGNPINVRYFFTNASNVQLENLPIQEVKDSNGGVVSGLHMHSIYIENVGTETATNVRIPMSTLNGVDYFIESSARVCREENNERTNTSVHFVIDRLVPGESALFTFLYLPIMNWQQFHLGHITHDAGIAKRQEVLFAARQPRWKIWLLNLIFVLGVVSLGALLILAYELIKPFFE